MNPGSTKNKPPQKIDQWVERVNKKIARLMGKKGKLPPTKKTSNTAFSLIIIGFSVLLWFVTGFYYLGENQFGLIMQNGKITGVVKGIKVGFTLPYPFGNIEIIDADMSDLIDIGKMSLTSTVFTVLSESDDQVVIDAKFAYQIVNPKLTFQTSLQQQDNLDTYVAWQVQIKLHDYFIRKSTEEILKSNLTVTANEIKSELNMSLATTGLMVNKLNIYSLKTPLMLANANATSTTQTAHPVVTSNMLPQVATKLLQEAATYKQNLIIDTQVNINQFNQLLPQYRTDHNTIITQMYYDALSAIPVIKSDNYPLLNLPLSQLLIDAQEESSLPVTNQEITPTTIRERHFSRQVSRMHNGDGSENE